MIVLNLACPAGHHFEGWFACSEAFEDQARRGLVCCPTCGDAAIQRLPSSPHVARAAKPGQPASMADAAAAVDMLRALLDGAENVGGRFPQEARRIHHQEVPPRSIRGTASVRDALDLLEEGIPVLPLPIPPKDEMN